MESKEKEGHTKVLVKFLEDDVEYWCPMSKVKDHCNIKKGDIRFVRWTDSQYYKAIILKVDLDGHVYVKFTTDHIKHKCSFDDIKNAFVLHVGDLRKVKWKDGKYYEAVITEIKNDQKNTLLEQCLNVCENSLEKDTHDFSGMERLNTEADDINISFNKNEKGEQNASSQCTTTSINEVDHQESDNQGNEGHTSPLTWEQQSTAHIAGLLLDENIPDVLDEPVLECDEPRTLQNKAGACKSIPREIRKKLERLELMINDWKKKVDSEKNEQDLHERRESPSPPTTHENKSENKPQPSKNNYCRYCHTWQKKIMRHFVNKHNNIPEIEAYTKITDQDTKKQVLLRREASKILISSSNSYHNSMVKNNKIAGKMIPTKQSKLVLTPMTHVTCSDCGAIVTKKYFSNHKLACGKRKSLLNIETSNSNPPNAYLIVPDIEKKYNVLKSQIFYKMKKDAISLLAQTDPMILEYGRRFLKCHMKQNQRNYVSSKIRTLADLVIRCQLLDPSIKTLEDCLQPDKFDTMCQTVRVWSQYSEESGECKHGSVPRRLSKTLKVCSEIIMSQAIKNKQLSVQKQIEIRDKQEKFLLLMKSDWLMEVTSIGDHSTKSNKMKKSEKVPLETDISKFCLNMKEIIEVNMTNLIKQDEMEHYNTLTKALLVFLTVFNGRRPSEVSYATLDDYATLTSSTDADQGLSVFKVTALKNDVRVAVVVPNFARNAIFSLINHRDFYNIQGNLLFPRQDGSSYNTSGLISKFKNSMDLKKPNDLSANGMRHYWATITQKHHNIKKHMPKFLGHTNQTHQKYYEMPLADIHLNVIGPLLEQTCFPSPAEQLNDHTKFNIMPNVSKKNHIASTSSLTSQSKEGKNENAVSHMKLRKKLSYTEEKTLSLINNVDDEETWEDDTDEDPDFAIGDDTYEPPKKKRQISKPKEESSSSDESLTTPIKSSTRNNWTTPEKEELFQGLTKTVLGLELPGRGKVQEVYQKSKIIKKRHSLQTLRIEASKYFQKKKIVPTPTRKKLLSKLDVKQN